MKLSNIFDLPVKSGNNFESIISILIFLMLCIYGLLKSLRSLIFELSIVVFTIALFIDSIFMLIIIFR
jgi:hypothetical protein